MRILKKERVEIARITRSFQLHPYTYFISHLLSNMIYACTLSSQSIVLSNYFFYIQTASQCHFWALKRTSFEVSQWHWCNQWRNDLFFPNYERRQLERK